MIFSHPPSSCFWASVHAGMPIALANTTCFTKYGILPFFPRILTKILHLVQKWPEGFVLNVFSEQPSTCIFFFIWTFMFMAMWVMSRIRIFFPSRSLPQEHVAKKKKKKRRLGKKSFPGRRRPKRLGFFFVVHSLSFPRTKFDTRFLFPPFWILSYGPFFLTRRCVRFSHTLSCTHSPCLITHARFFFRFPVVREKYVVWMLNKLSGDGKRPFLANSWLNGLGQKRGGEPKKKRKEREARDFFAQAQKNYIYFE